jgi:hypothetical protein
MIAEEEDIKVLKPGYYESEGVEGSAGWVRARTVVPHHSEYQLSYFNYLKSLFTLHHHPQLSVFLLEIVAHSLLITFEYILFP